MENLNILITGSNGLIGSYLYNFLSGNNFNVVGIDSIVGPTVDLQFDLIDTDGFEKELDIIKPNIIIHTAAVKSLKECEENNDKSWRINVESTSKIVEFFKKHNGKVIYISSDVVFDGKEGAYKESDKPSPINFYGKTKYASEKLIMTLNDYAICRTALVIGDLNNDNRIKLIKEIDSGEPLNNQSLLPYYILEKLSRNEKIKLPNSIISSPTDVRLLGVSILNIIQKNLKGIFHCVGSEAISRYDFAIKVAEHFHEDKKIIDIDDDEILSIRPKNLSMEFSETYNSIGILEKDWDVNSLLNKINKTKK